MKILTGSKVCEGQNSDVFSPESVKFRYRRYSPDEKRKSKRIRAFSEKKVPMSATNAYLRRSDFFGTAFLPLFREYSVKIFQECFFMPLQNLPVGSQTPLSDKARCNPSRTMFPYPPSISPMLPIPSLSASPKSRVFADV